ncbi:MULTISPECIES: hypothetical protein [unclassified Oceanispirochaeta]|uniref:hypothetical protein n=1 Tax=unclassified Oceanispirochaeta TaxID=2635722 RepID=UPI000E08E905|nr:MULTISPECIES: hypothetical protein [unclassified Oceanispirochaeta]MBF9016309.1 hypothetical protein [Oceanispirochaeta sp. M2]NPD72772.1 hypothetical protein [Oceanispirochaeta sp. M1]RDG31617.1 hypothetical protein DV872_11735 [Oceanispirochaeta sp. M1]
MKYLNMLFVLLILSSPLIAEESAQIMTMDDFDASMMGFSFSLGELVSANADDESLPMEIDFIFDIPNGLGMNNAALGDWFKGNAMILDLGEIELDESAEILEADYSPYLIPDEIIPGHTYQIMTADASHYGRIKVLEFNYDNSHLSFEWIKIDK